MIPDDAVEAAAMVLCEQLWDNAHEKQRAYARDEAREALETAAPHMLADCWDAAFNAGRDRGEWEAAPVTEEPTFANPYRPAP